MLHLRPGYGAQGFAANEAETFCRLVGPSYAVRECTGYSDRRAASATAETRRIGFVTEIQLMDENEVRSKP